MSGAPQWRVFADADAVAAAARDEIVALAASAIAERGRFTLALAGGETPRRTYARLAESVADFSRWRFFLGDERCLPPDDPSRNSVMIRRSLLDPAGIDARAFYPIPAELGAEAAAERYARQIAGWQPFDCVLLGMGEDGHTASLFPGQRHPDDRLAAPVHNAPKPPPDRVTLTLPVFRSARRLLFIVTGAGKREAIARWRRGEATPAAQAAGAGNAVVLLDQAAWPSEDEAGE